MCAPDFPQNQFFTRFSDSFFKSPQKILSPNRSPGPSIRAFTVPKERDCRERERLGAGARSSPGSIADARRRRGVYSSFSPTLNGKRDAHVFLLSPGGESGRWVRRCGWAGQTKAALFLSHLSRLCSSQRRAIEYYTGCSDNFDPPCTAKTTM